VGIDFNRVMDEATKTLSSLTRLNDTEFIMSTINTMNLVHQTSPYTLLRDMTFILSRGDDIQKDYIKNYLNKMMDFPESIFNNETATFIIVVIKLREFIDNNTK
jgi:hypothetical protein